jgi:hypothetical protein
MNVLNTFMDHIRQLDNMLNESCELPENLRSNGVVKYAWIGFPEGHVRCRVPGNRKPGIDIALKNLLCTE